MAVLLAVFSTMCIGSGEFLASGVTKRTRAHEVTTSMFVAGVAFTATVALIWPGEPTTADMFWGALAGAANGTAILLIYLAYSRGSLRSAAPAAAVVMSAVPIGWDVLISGTNPSPLTWAGILLGVIAIALTSYDPADGQDDQRSLAIAIAAGAIFGVMLIFLGEIGEDSGGRPIVLQRFVGLLVAASVTRATGPRFLPEDRKIRAVSMLIGLFATAALVLFVLALQSGGSLAIVSVISSQYAAVAVLLGVALRGQTMTRWQSLGLAGASLAVALITIG